MGYKWPGEVSKFDNVILSRRNGILADFRFNKRKILCGNNLLAGATEGKDKSEIVFSMNTLRTIPFTDPCILRRPGHSTGWK